MMTEKQEGAPVLFTSTDSGGISVAANVLRAGGLVAFPTETVYGVGARTDQGAAVAKIFALKGRPTFNPLITHVCNRAEAENFAVFHATARMISDAFWPGPLTLILPLREGQTDIHPLVTAGLDSVAVRVPAHPVALNLIAAAGGPLAAPSANPSGCLSPTTPMHVADGFLGNTPLILAGGATQAGLESTILDLTVDPAVILRPGPVTPDDLASFLGYVPRVGVGHYKEGDRPKSPGLLLKHYAPTIPVRLCAVDVLPDEAVLAFGSVRFLGMRTGSGSKGLAREILAANRFLNLSETGDLFEAAANLFKMLHELDQTGATCIAVMDIPKTGLGLAIRDRLERAASRAD